LFCLLVLGGYRETGNGGIDSGEFFRHGGLVSVGVELVEPLGRYSVQRT
jgi:hypothetical protein